jgi:hypothetical protein
MDDILEFDVKHELATMIDDNSLIEKQMLPISKKMSKSFKRFYLEYLILESPIYNDDIYPTRLNEWEYNATEALAFTEGRKGKLIGDFYYKGKILIYEIDGIDKNIDNKTIEYTLLTESKIIVLGRAKLIIKKIDNKEYYFTNGLWNHESEGTGVIYNFFINWLLPKYKTVISDNVTSKLGKNFWVKIIEYGLTNNKECGKYVDPESRIEDITGFIPLIRMKDFLDTWKHNMREKRIYIKI